MMADRDDRDDGNVAKGVMIGLAICVPLWALIIWMLV